MQILHLSPNGANAGRQDGGELEGISSWQGPPAAEFSGTLT